MTRTFLILILLKFGSGFSQNFDKLGQDDALKISGGIALNSVLYLQDGKSQSFREPFTWYSSGKLDISLIEFDLPFTFTYSNQGGKYTQPFNRTAFHPSYKWAQAHLGMISANFSKYTLTGHLFLGGCLELKPGKWNIQLMTGRLVKAVAYDPFGNNLNDIRYSRWGYGLKSQYKFKKLDLGVILLKASDKPSSITAPVNSEILPQDNISSSIQTKIQLTKSLSLTYEHAISLLTKNVRDSISYDPANSLSNLILVNNTTSFYQAFNGSVQYKIKQFGIALKLEHIDPGYKTLGGYYFNNDLQNYTVAPTMQLLKGKVSFNSNFGYQINNIKATDASQTKRFIGAIGLVCVPVQSLVFTANYSNFSTVTNSRPQTDPFYFNQADTLDFYQLNQTISSLLSYTKKGKRIGNSTQLNYTYNQVSSTNGSFSSSSPLEINYTASMATEIHSGIISNSLQWLKKKASLIISANLNTVISPSARSTFWGPTIGISKQFNNNLKFSLGTTANSKYSDYVHISNIYNHRIGISYQLKSSDKQGTFNLSLNANLLQQYMLSSSKNTTELNGFFNLAYNF